MLKWKKLAKALLFPHTALLLVLTPLAITAMVYSLLFLGAEAPVAIASYVLAAYTLTVWCVKIPRIIKLAKNFKNENKYAVRWFGDPHLRVKVSLYGSLLWNSAYALFQLGLGFYHASFWYDSMAGYYLSLAVMRFFLVEYTRKHRPGENMRLELQKYRTCGVIFLFLNLALTLMIFFMVYWNRTFVHHEITTIIMAAYTFTAFTAAIVSIVKYRKYNSPVFSASKAIALAAACVSMLTLTSTMLTTFGRSDEQVFRELMLGLLGGAVSIFIITMAIYMIVQSTKKIRTLKSEVSNERSSK